MSNLRDAAQQALEAMEKATRFMTDADYRKLNESIDVLKDALAEPEKCSPDMCLHCVALQERLDTLTNAVLRSNGIS